MEEDQEVKPVTSIREYLKNGQEVGKVFHFVSKEITTPESRRWLYKMLLLLLCSVILSTIQPAALSFVFNGLATHDRTSVLGGLIGFAILLSLTKRLDCSQQKAREWVLGIHMQKLNDRISELLFQKSIAQHVQEGHLLSISSIDKGRSRLIDLQGMFLFDGIPTMIQLILSVLFLSILNWISGLIMLGVIILYVSWCLYLNFKVTQCCTSIDRDFRKLNRKMVERWERVERVIVTGQEARELSELATRYQEILTKDRIFWLWFIGNANIRSFLNLFGLIAIMSWGTWLVWKGAWQIGLLYPLFAWSMRVSENIWKLGDIEHKINWNLPSVKHLIKALELPPAIIDCPDAIKIDSELPHVVEFRDVSHTYPAEVREKIKSLDADALPAIVRVSFKIEVGEKVALIGSSGAGKTTVMKKLLRFDDPTTGAILVDGVDLRQITQTSWRSGIGYIPQQAQIFDGTIRENLIYGLNPKDRANITDEKLWKMMHQLQIDFGKRLGQGLDTIVGKNGLKLSGGEEIGRASCRERVYVLV